MTGAIVVNFGFLVGKGPFDLLCNGLGKKGFAGFSLVIYLESGKEVSIPGHNQLVDVLTKPRWASWKTAESAANLSESFFEGASPSPTMGGSNSRVMLDLLRMYQSLNRTITR